MGSLESVADRSEILRWLSAVQKMAAMTKLLRFCSAAMVSQLVKIEEDEIDDWLNVDLCLAHFKQVMV